MDLLGIHHLTAISANIREKKSGVVRTAMGLHLRDETFARLVRHPRLVMPAQQIAGPDLYVQQVKINVKSAFDGELWQWHHKREGMVFLVTEGSLASRFSAR